MNNLYEIGDLIVKTSDPERSPLLVVKAILSNNRLLVNYAEPKIRLQRPGQQGWCVYSVDYEKADTL